MAKNPKRIDITHSYIIPESGGYIQQQSEHLKSTILQHNIDMISKARKEKQRLLYSPDFPDWGGHLDGVSLTQTGRVPLTEPFLETTACYVLAQTRLPRGIQASRDLGANITNPARALVLGIPVQASFSGVQPPRHPGNSAGCCGAGSN